MPSDLTSAVSRALRWVAGAAGAAAVAYGVSHAYEAHWEAERARLVEETSDAQKRAEEHLARHFDSVQLIADNTTLPALLPHVRTRLFALADVGEITRQLRQAREGGNAVSAEEKLELWHTLTRRSFVRCLAGLWSAVLMDVYVRVQLNVLGRHLYLDSAVGRAAAGLAKAPAPTAADSPGGSDGRSLPVATQHCFLALADYFPMEGVEMLVDLLFDAVDGALGDVDLQQELSPERLSSLLRRCSDRFAQNVTGHEGAWVGLLMPEGAEQVVGAMQEKENEVPKALPTPAVSEGAVVLDEQADRGGEADVDGTPVASTVASTPSTPSTSSTSERAAASHPTPKLERGRDVATLRFLATETREALDSQRFVDTVRSAAAAAHEVLAATIAQQWPAEGSTMTPVKGGEAAAIGTPASAASVAGPPGSSAASTPASTPPETPVRSVSVPPSAAVEAVTPQRVLTLRPLALAKLVPLVAGTAGAMLDPPAWNPYVRIVASLPAVRELAAHVYSDFS